MKAMLRVNSGTHAERDIIIPFSKFFIGRSEDCHLRINDDTVSRHHCVLLIQDGRVHVRDFGSRNGTFVNGERVMAERALHPGDVLRVGLLEFVVLFRQDVESAPERAALSVLTRSMATVRGPTPPGTGLR